jgi:hypothetical protein
MTLWALDYLPGAIEELADVWTGAPDRNAVTSAASVIDRLLQGDPQGSGRHLSEGLYQLHESPLAVYYTVDPATVVCRSFRSYIDSDSVPF